MDPKSTNLCVRRTVLQRLRVPGVWLICIVTILSALTLRVSQAGPPSPSPDVVQLPHAEAHTPAPEQDVLEPHVSDEILVRFTPQSTTPQRTAILSQHNAQIQQQIQRLGVVVLKVSEQPFRQTLSALQHSSVVEFAEPNYLAVAQDSPPNDPDFPQQWGLEAIGAPAAWSIQTGSSDVVIAFVDTGVDLNHPDLKNKIVAGWDFVNNDNDPQDDNGHGTHVAGIAAAETNNGTGIAGVSWGARIMSIKALDSTGSGSYADIAEGIIYAVDHGAKVINLSLGGTAPSVTLEDAVNYAYDHGVVVVAAAGNLGASGVTYPARYANAIAVAAVDSDLNLAPFSSQGAEVDIAAPGTDIYSTYINGIYEAMSGTSMAASYVSGAAALLMSSSKFDTPAEVRSALENTALDLGSPGPDDYFGRGLMNARNSLPSHSDTSMRTTPTPQASPSATPGSDEPIELDRANGVLVSYTWDETGIYFYVSKLDGSERRLVFKEEAATVPLKLATLSPDGTRLAYVSSRDQMGFSDAGIKVIDLKTSAVLLKVDPEKTFFNVNPLWAPDSNYLAFSRGYPQRTSKVTAELWLANVNSGKVRPLVADETFGPAFFFGKSYAIAWGADGSSIQYYDEIGSEKVYKFDISARQAVQVRNSEIERKIADYINRIATARSTSTSTMTKPISGLVDYDGRVRGQYTTVYLDNYSGGTMEGGGGHPGVDIGSVTCGQTSALSVAAGQVWQIDASWTYNLCGDNSGSTSAGNYAIIRYDISEAGGYAGVVYGVYEHLHHVTVGPCSGNCASIGSEIGKVGSTGNSDAPHLHFQLERDSVQFHPYWPSGCCNDPSIIPTVIAYTVNPMMFVQAHESSAGVTVYDLPNYNPNISARYETFRVSDPYLRENPIGDNIIWVQL